MTDPTYTPSVIVPAEGGEFVWWQECDVCGGHVYDTDRHTAWHARLDARPAVITCEVTADTEPFKEAIRRARPTTRPTIKARIEGRSIIDGYKAMLAVINGPAGERYAAEDPE
jgi:hypothetical protein